MSQYILIFSEKNPQFSKKNKIILGEMKNSLIWTLLFSFVTVS